MDSPCPIRNEKADLSLSVLFVLLAVAMVLFMSWMKIGELLSLRYSTDVFLYDQIMQEMLRGHFGMEFMYGNQFGDHSLLWLVLMTPLKLLLMNRMIFVLVLMGPLIYGLSVVLFYFTMRSLAGALPSFLVSLVFLFPYLVVRGLMESEYGAHFDTLSGYIALALVCCLLLRQSAIDAGEAATRATRAFWVLLTLFLMLKEEMALLAIIFFAVVAALRPSRLHLTGLAVALSAFVAEMLFIKWMSTPWNRTNSGVLLEFVDMVRKGDIAKQALSPGGMGALWTTTVFAALFLASYLPAWGRQPYALGLLAMGAAKMAMGFIAHDIDLASWHSFPGIVMMTAALATQLACTASGSSVVGKRTARALGGVVLVSGLALFVSAEIPFARDIRERQSYVADRILTPEVRDGRRQSLEAVRAKIAPGSVVAISWTPVLDWNGEVRYAFYPHGLFGSPRGIAEYLVADLTFPDIQLSSYLQTIGRNEFHLILQTPYHQLYQRNALSSQDAWDRMRFMRHFGPDAIGSPPPHPILGG